MANPLEIIEKEWPVIRQAPWSFAGAAATCLVIGFGVSAYYWSDKVSIAKETRDLYATCLRTGVMTERCATLVPQPTAVAEATNVTPISANTVQMVEFGVGADLRGPVTIRDESGKVIFSLTAKEHMSLHQ